MERLIIIGSGPAGLAAGIYAGRAQLKPLLIQGPMLGGQMTQTSEVENYPGFDKGILGTVLMSQMKNQAERFGTRVVAGEVISLKKEGQTIIVKTERGDNYESRAVLVATGANAKWLGLESETRLRGKGVSACATCDGCCFRGQTIAVIGGGDTAMEEANFLTRFASLIYLVHRRDSFKASKIMQERVLSNPKIKVIYNAQVIEVLGQDRVSGLKLKITEGGVEKERELPIEGLFVAIGHAPATGFLKGSGVALDEMGYVLTGQKAVKDSEFQYQTSVPGIFAAGDCVDRQYRQAAVAAGMGVAAELEIEKYLLVF